MVSFLRDGTRQDLPLDVQDRWLPATSFADLNQYVPVSQPEPSLGEFLLKAALVVGGAVVVYKVGQAILDEDFGGRSFPTSFRTEKINDHLDTHGAFCPKCERRVRVGELTLDHIVPWSKGGLTSSTTPTSFAVRVTAKRDRAHRSSSRQVRVSQYVGVR